MAKKVEGGETGTGSFFEVGVSSGTSGAGSGN